MINLLSSFFLVFISKLKVQDLPAHLYALKVAAGAVFITETLALLRQEPVFVAAFLAAVKLALLAAIVFFLLKVHLKPERWQQTMIALFGAQFVLNLLTIPFINDLLEFMRQYQQVATENPAQLSISPGLIVVVIAQLWYLVLMMRIFRESMEISTVRAILNTFLVIYLTTIALGALIGAFGSTTGVPTSYIE